MSTLELHSPVDAEPLPDRRAFWMGFAAGFSASLAFVSVGAAAHPIDTREGDVSYDLPKRHISAKSNISRAWENVGDRFTSAFDAAYRPLRAPTV